MILTGNYNSIIEVIGKSYHKTDIFTFVFRGLANIPSQSLIDTVNKAGEGSARSQESVQDAVSAISDILTMLPEQSQMAKQVPKDFGDSRDAINQADIQCKPKEISVTNSYSINIIHRTSTVYFVNECV